MLCWRCRPLPDVTLCNRLLRIVSSSSALPAFAQIMRCMSNSQQLQHQHVVTLSFNMHMSPDACVADAVYRLPSICKNALYGLAGLTQLSWL